MYIVALMELTNDSTPNDFFAFHSLQTCRMGGEPHLFVDDCAGPCDLTAIQGGKVNFGSPESPAAIYERGQKVNIKYSRNNHGPGGFIRFTLVPADKIMDASVHSKNAFHYTCWGAKAVEGHGTDLEEDQFGYSLVGNDGEEHKLPRAYYETELNIPKVVPDGAYILGWLWFGGVGHPVTSNKPQEPKPWGYFADYHSCSFVRIEKGPKESEHQPTFRNDMSQFSKTGCMAMNDSPGVCVWEPCLVQAIYQKPAGFKNGEKPAMLTPADFGAPNNWVSPKSNGRNPRTQQKILKRNKLSCDCLSKGKKCKEEMSLKAHRKCKARLPFNKQDLRCKKSCCLFCRRTNSKKLRRRYCKLGIIRKVCSKN